MSEHLPPPLVPADTDLRDFVFMPLDVVRLRDSSLAVHATGEEFRAAVLLWCAAWHQIPAASLPDDDAVLAQLAGFGRVVKEWRKVRNGALRGWVKCNDGRLYHPVVAEKANEAWDAKREQRWRTECARIKKHNQRHGTDVPIPSFDEWLADGCPQGQPLPVPRDKRQMSPGTPPARPSGNALQGTVKGQGQGHIGSTSNPPTTINDTTPNQRAPARVVDGDKPTPAGEMAAALRQSGIDVTSMTPTLLAWIRDGYSTEQLLEAVQLARVHKPPPQRIPANYLDAVLRGQAQTQPTTITASGGHGHADSTRRRKTGAEILAEGCAGAFDGISGFDA